MPRLDLDLGMLEHQFHKLSRKLHPDRFARASVNEKEWSLADTALLNDAYRTLRDPIHRTEYLLKLQGAEIGEEHSGKDRRDPSRVPADLLPKVDHDLTMVDKPNSIALRIAMVAADEADLLATLRWGYEWDIAAACLIARESGAAVTDAFGHAFDFNKRDPRAFGLLVTAPAIHEAAVARLAERAARLA